MNLNERLERVGLKPIVNHVYNSAYDTTTVPHIKQIENLIKPYQRHINWLTIGLVLSFSLNAWAWLRGC